MSQKRRDIDHLLDLYWGGKERRITGLTVRIIAVNALALIMLLIGFVYLGQYHGRLVEAKLSKVEAEIGLISAALSEDAIVMDVDRGASFSADHLQRMIYKLSQRTPQRIRVFGQNQTIIADSYLINPRTRTNNLPIKQLESIKVLKGLAKFALSILPEKEKLQTYPNVQAETGVNFPDVPNALRANLSASAWRNAEGHIFISTAAPLYKDNRLAGAVLLTHAAYDIEHELEAMWSDILIAFLLTFFLTTLISIYFAGVIAEPLKKLAYAAEGVRKGKLGYDDIPDFSARKDEIGELSVAFRQMTRSLSKRMDSIEQFAADVAHELKNPLTSLRSAVETLSIVKKKGDREKLLGVINHDVGRLNRLITDISGASRLDAALSRESVMPVDVYELWSNILDAHKSPLKRQSKVAEKSVDIGGVKINLIKEDGLNTAQVWGIEGRLEQVFQNILSNALSFTLENKSIDVRLKAVGNYLRISVEDEGTGVPEPLLERIFERFYTERPHGESYGDHSGLGLAICRQIITALGGDIYAENIIDRTGAIKGARFIVELRKV